MEIINSIFYFIPKLFILFLICIFLSFIIQFIYISMHEHKKIIKSDTPSTYIRRGILKRLLKDFPEALARDILDRDPDEFPHNGFHCYCGEQGSGKTVSLVARLRELKQKHPKVKILSNFDCEFSDGLVKDWKDIVFTENGKQGIIIALDEIQNWFSTNESKDFPPEMIQEICQQRKQHKMIMGTSQRFQRMAKPLREQINFLYEPITFAGCLTFVRIRKPFVDDDGKLDGTGLESEALISLFTMKSSAIHTIPFKRSSDKPTEGIPLRRLSPSRFIRMLQLRFPIAAGSFSSAAVGINFGKEGA